MVVVLACFLTTVKGVRLYDVGSAAVIRGEEVILWYNCMNVYDANCVDICLKWPSPWSPGQHTAKATG